MWCRHCQQQTPALGPPGANGPRCGRCQRTSPAPAEPVATTDAPRDDADEARRQIYRSLRSAHAIVSAGEAARTLRYDLAETPLAEGLGAPRRRPAPNAEAAARSRPAPPTGYTPRGQTAAWLLAAAGATSLGLGIGLAAWSLVGQRPELWNPALAAAIGGQGLMIVGLVQLLTSLWNAARGAAGKLALVHEELRRLRRSSEEQAGRHHASASAFYADLAREAPAEMLVGNLRGQLDRLAARLR